MKQLVFVWVVIFSLVACNRYSTNLEKALNESGKNKPELEKVLEFYSKNPRDSLKYKAAVFLIENMPNHFSYKYISDLESAFDSIDKYPNDISRGGIFGKILDSVSKKRNIVKSELLPDIKYVKSKFLINTIELSFKSWYKIPKEKRASFDDFCNYILPYKTSDEPIEVEAREKLAKKYSWVHDALQKGVSIKAIVDSIATAFNFRPNPKIQKYYPISLTISQVEKSRLGLCDDGVNYLVNVFRALGIVSAKDMVSHWGNHHAFGHSWIYVKYGKEEFSTDVGGKIDLKAEYIAESMPKVYRMIYKSQDEYSYSQFAKDVTNTYVPTVNISVENVFKTPESLAVLCVFDSKKDWIPISFGKNENDKQQHDNMGVNVLYLASSQKEDKINPINYPFFIDYSKKIHFFKPQKNSLDSVIITRKYPLITPRNKSKFEWIKNLNDAVFEGANNPDFKNATVLYKISNFNSVHVKKIILSGNKKFKYVRFSSNKKTFLAKIAFYGNSGEKLEGELIKNDTLTIDLKKGAFDNHPVTFTEINSFLGYKFKEKKQIHSIEFQARNDNNHINIDAEYELFFWEKKWKSLGVQIAQDTVLYYKAPHNSLLKLERIDKDGIEQHVFIASKNKKQQWFGSK